ncbi:hypothetical protein [Flammeovirga pacifica]|uniref:Uncharacterized protein n=1 Tax=Flammeovirga pacifica TaxID=915059 RepID=A0A1S1Z259_FLAPC|nr:hypothetical protein [Flammeovirga pacifica]OHX67358.1 hypothetical protein NH26_13905 [Flammeovirga pacifica]
MKQIEIEVVEQLVKRKLLTVGKDITEEEAEELMSLDKRSYDSGSDGYNKLYEIFSDTSFDDPDGYDEVGVYEFNK